MKPPFLCVFSLAKESFRGSVVPERSFHVKHPTEPQTRDRCPMDQLVRAAKRVQRGACQARHFSTKLSTGISTALSTVFPVMHIAPSRCTHDVPSVFNDRKRKSSWAASASRARDNPRGAPISALKGACSQATCCSPSRRGACIFGDEDLLNRGPLISSRTY